MSYELQFYEAALSEWRKLDSTLRTQFKKALAKRLENPRVPSASLAGMPDCYKIKLCKAGYRLVYRVEDQIVTVTVIAVGRRDKSEVYRDALSRIRDSE